LNLKADPSVHLIDVFNIAQILFLIVIQKSATMPLSKNDADSLTALSPLTLPKSYLKFNLMLFAEQNAFNISQILF
jgi:hypothetical protein